VSTTPTKRAPARRRPADRLPKIDHQRADALDEPVTFEFDGDEFTTTMRACTRLDFLAAIEDEQIITAFRSLIGVELVAQRRAARQARRRDRCAALAGRVGAARQQAASAQAADERAAEA
jgi:hypothetical protein